jgi:hypothetical protein
MPIVRTYQKSWSWIEVWATFPSEYVENAIAVVECLLFWDLDIWKQHIISFHTWRRNSIGDACPSNTGCILITLCLMTLQIGWAFMVNPVIISAFVDVNHGGNVVTRHSHSGILIYVQNAPIIWFSKMTKYGWRINFRKWICSIMNLTGYDCHNLIQASDVWYTYWWTC